MDIRQAEFLAHTGGMWISFALLFLMQSPAARLPEPGFAVALDARFVRDLHDKKIDDVLTLYTAYAVFVNPDGRQNSGAGLRKLYEQVGAAFDSDLQLKPAHFQRHGKTAEEDGTYEEALGHRDTGKVEQMRGTFRFEMRKEPDGQWRYSRMEWH